MRDSSCYRDQGSGRLGKPARWSILAVVQVPHYGRIYEDRVAALCGVKARPRWTLVGALAKGHKPRSGDEYEEQVAGLWAGEYREERHAALDWAMRFQPFMVNASLRLHQRLIREGQ